MKRILVAVVVAVVLATTVHAQGPSGPFLLLGYIDMIGAPTSIATTNMPTHIGQLVSYGWLFECQSGLQPVTQRIGTVSVFFVNDLDEHVAPAKYQLLTNDRPDVAAYWANICPAVGANVGFTLYTDPPPTGFWVMHIVATTRDGAGRKLQNEWVSPLTYVEN